MDRRYRRGRGILIDQDVRMVRAIPRGRGATEAHTDLARAVSGAIGFYHMLAGIFLFLGLTKKWRILTHEMNKNQRLSFLDYETLLIRPYAFRISANIVYFGLGILLFIGACKRSRLHCEAWLICAATMDFFVIILGTEFEDPVYGVVWEVVKSICEISVVWSFTMDLRKEEAVVAPQPGPQAHNPAELELLEPQIQVDQVPIQQPLEVDENQNEREFNLDDVFSPNEARRLGRAA